MDTVLVVVTLVSLALAGAMSVLVAKMLREERRRSDARVAALLELAAESDAQPRAVAPAPKPIAARRLTSRPVGEPGVSGRRETPLDEMQIRPAGDVVAQDMFLEAGRSSPWGRRVGVIGVLAAIGVGVALLAGRGASAPSGSPAVSREAAAPLELVSMRHTHDGATLTISGMVHNPRTGAALTRVAVSAMAFGPDGALLATGRAPLDYTSLAAGEESPFVVTVPVHGTVVRYRVGFRSEDGGVVAHVDRRAGDVSRAGM